MDQPRCTTFEDLYAALACSTRLAILCLLSSREAYVTELCRTLGYGMPLVSSHLKVLRHSGIIRFRLHKGRRYYSHTAAIRVNQSYGVFITLTSDDGSVLTASIPRSAPVMRVLRDAHAVEDGGNPVAIVEVRPLHPKPARSKGTRTT